MVQSGACRMRQCPASPRPGRLWTLLLALVGSPLPSPVRSQPHGADPGPNPTGTAQGVPTPPVVPPRDKMPWKAARLAAGGNGKGRKGSPPSPTGYLGVPAAWGSSSPAAGLGSCRRGEQDELRAGSPVKVQPDSPRKLPRHGPAPPPPGLPRAHGERPLIPRAAPLPTLPAATSALPPRDPPVPAAGQGPFVWREAPFLPSPFGCGKPPCCHRRGVKIECGEGTGVKNPLLHVSCWHCPARCPHAVLRAGRALSPGVAQPRG